MKLLQAIAFIIHMLWAMECFVLHPMKITKIPQRLHDDVCNNCNEKVIYRNYLLGLRKVRKTIKTTNVDSLISILNFTNAFVANTTFAVNQTEINNDELGAKKLIMANIHIDVSHVKYIQISTKNDTIIIELDKKKKLDTIMNDIGNVDALINTLSLIMKVLGASNGS